MRKFIIAAAIAVTAAVTFSAPSQAGSIKFQFGHGHGHHYTRQASRPR